MKKYEVEQKFRVSNPAAIRKLLTKLRAKFLCGGQEKNELWDYQGRLLKKNSVLRLRETQGKGMLTFKGPRLRSRFKKRVETETCVDVVAMRQILQTLGYRVRVRYEKKREEYLLGGAHITLDWLKRFGWFVEIEASPRIIDALSRKLGFTNKDREERSYLEMIYGNRSLWAGK